jgi:uncharacterized UPF0160 family protein
MDLYLQAHVFLIAQFRVTIPWGGCRDSELEKESGIAGAKFVHSSGFIGGNKTREGALAMCVETLRNAKKI